MAGNAPKRLLNPENLDRFDPLALSQPTVLRHAPIICARVFAIRIYSLSVKAHFSKRIFEGGTC
jgi:hypothetical protein